ncbi:sterol desaturase family protein [Neisseria sp. Ec49-e6-T10]|uniref:sterol desaturase family protein n=1 Tax=Neisseria sp. Ec49-e6-T10 TaxID=3140744 RepID=UPI003EBC44CB
MNNLTIPIIFMLCTVMAEVFFIKFYKKQRIDWQDVMFNLNSGHMMLWLFRGLEVVCYHYVLAHFSFGLFDSWPIVFVWLFALIAWDFGFYWLHRLHHRLRFFWAVHIVHHQGEHFNLSLAVRNSWYSSLTSIPFFLLLALAGLPTHIFVMVSIFHYSIQFFNHNVITPKLGFLEKILVTPSHHRVHHVKDQYYSNRNYGGSFIIWDKLFGTFEAELPKKEFSYGSYNMMPTANPFWASNVPFIEYFKFPFLPNQSTRSYSCSNFIITSGTLILFALVIGYIFIYGYGYSSGISINQLSLFGLLVLGSIALGGICEGKKWAKVLWLMVSVAFPLLFIVCWHWYHWFWISSTVLIALHGIAFFIGLGRMGVQEIKV